MNTKTRIIIATLIIIILALLALLISNNKQQVVLPVQNPESPIALVPDQKNSLVDTTETTHVNNQEVGNQPVACTMDAHICADGSYVGRSGPNCEFVCPPEIKVVVDPIAPPKDL